MQPLPQGHGDDKNAIDASVKYMKDSLIRQKYDGHNGICYVCLFAGTAEKEYKAISKMLASGEVGSVSEVFLVDKLYNDAAWMQENRSLFAKWKQVSSKVHFVTFAQLQGEMARGVALNPDTTGIYIPPDQGEIIRQLKSLGITYNNQLYSITPAQLLSETLNEKIHREIVSFVHAWIYGIGKELALVYQSGRYCRISTTTIPYRAGSGNEIHPVLRWQEIVAYQMDRKCNNINSPTMRALEKL